MKKIYIQCSQVQRNKKNDIIHFWYSAVQSSLAIKITCLQLVYLGRIAIAQGGWWISRGPRKVTACC